MLSAKVSIIVPVYNAESYIDKCINSLILQSYENLEILFIDDGSPDDCACIIKKYQQNDNRIKLFQQLNSGASIARNVGITNSTGNYIMFVDSDDWIEKNAVEIMINNVLKSKADMVTCGYYDISPGRTLEINDFQGLNSNQNAALEICVRRIILQTGGKITGFLMKKSLLIGNGINFNPSIKICEDLLVVLRCIVNAKRICFLDQSLYYYNRMNEHSLTFNNSVKNFEEHIKVQKELKKILTQANLNNNIISALLFERDYLYLSGLFFSVIKNSKNRRKVIQNLLKHAYIQNKHIVIKQYRVIDRLSVLAINRRSSLAVYIVYNIRLFLQKMRNALVLHGGIFNL